MKTILIILLSLPFFVFGQANKKRADCLIALSKLDNPKNSPPQKIGPEGQWQWDGKQLSLSYPLNIIKNNADPRAKNTESVWSVEKYKENGDGRLTTRFYGKTAAATEIPPKVLDEVQGELISYAILTLMRAVPTRENAVDLDKLYSECESIEDVVPVKAPFGKKSIVTKKTVGEISRTNREKIRSQFPKIFGGATSSSGISGGSK